MEVITKRTVSGRHGEYNRTTGETIEDLIIWGNGQLLQSLQNASDLVMDACTAVSLAGDGLSKKHLLCHGETMAISPHNYPSEAGHFYKRTGEPCYEIEGKNGPRPTTLRDARKLGLVPGVTTLIKMAANQSLLNYIKRQVLLAALILPKIDGESEDAWVERVMADADEHRIKAAERGTQIHAWIQQGFEGRPLSDDGEIYYHVAKVELLKHGFDSPWRCERTFARDGYGGKVDLWRFYRRPSTKDVIIDIKTKDTPLDGLKTWDDMHMQLAAYRHGLSDPGAKCGILFVSTRDVDARLVMIPEEQLQRGWTMFQALLDYWYAKTGLAHGKERSEASCLSAHPC